jgi:hypothetical protein
MKSRFLTGLSARFGMTSLRSWRAEGSMENRRRILSIGRNYTIGAMWMQAKEI